MQSRVSMAILSSKIFIYFSGQSGNSTPRWIGITGINKKLGDISNSLDTVAANYKQAFQGSGFLQTDPVDFNNSLTNFFNTYKTRYAYFKISTLTSPNPLGITPIIPAYISNLGDHTKSSTILGIIYTEYSQRINLGSTLLNTISSSSSAIDKNIQPIKTSLQSTQAQIGSLQTSMQSMDSGFVTPMTNFVIII